MKRTFTSLMALLFTGAVALPLFAQTAPADNLSSASESSSTSTSETNNGVTTTHQSNTHRETGNTGNGTYSEHSNQQFEGTLAVVPECSEQQRHAKQRQSDCA